MALKFRRGTESGRSAITPAEGEPIFTTDTKQLYIGDGTTAGGVAVGGGGGVTDGDKGDVTVSASGATWTIDNGAVVEAKIANDAVTYAKIQNVSTTSRLLGRATAGAGDVEEITIGSGLTLTGTTISASGGLSDGDKGDVTVSSSGATWTIDNDAVSYAKMQNVSAASRLLGRGSASGSGDVQELTIGTGLTLTGTELSASGGGGGLGSPTIEVVKSADETVANSTTLINDTHLYCNLTANKVYYFTIILLGKCISGSSSHFKSAVSGNSEGHCTIDYEATPVLLNGTSTLTVPRVNSGSSTLPVVGIINGVCAPTSNTTLQFKWAQNTLFANGNVIMKGSKLQIWEIA